MDPSTSTSTSTSSMRNSEDVDFHDVFGGPPRRCTGHEVRHGMSVAMVMESRRYRDEEEGVSSSIRWSGLGERPVFGEEGVTYRRRYPSEDFFDDIFRGENKDPYASSPVSRIMSPARPLPNKSDPFGSSSLLAQFSLPAKMNKAMELPSYSSTNRGPYSNNDAPNQPSVPNSRSNSQSRLSGQSYKSQDEAKNGTRLSIEFSLSADGSVKVTESETDSGETIKKDSNSSNVAANSNQFHFSIHKWASKGVPLMISLRSSKGSKQKENNLSRCLSSNGRMDGESVNELHTEALSGVDIESKRLEHEKDDSEETVFATPIKKTVDTDQSTLKSVPDYTILSSTKEEKKPNSLLERVIEKKEKVTTKLIDKARKSELRSIRSLISESDDGQGNGKTNKDKDMHEYLAKTTVMSVKNIRRRDDKKALDKATLPMVDALEGNKMKGKVKEFVNIFNKETPAKRVVGTQKQSFKWKDAGNLKAEKDVNAGTTRTDELLRNIDLVKEKTTVNTSIKMDEDSKQSKEQDSVTEPSICTINDAYDQKKNSPSIASISDGSKATFESLDDFLDDNFSVKELSEDQNVLFQSGQEEDEFKASEAKIRGWSYGKETNIRSLLSTLQYVLWPESGWKPVPLVDIIEGNAVKRAYQRALLSLHPDKLQQKGVDAHKKYIAEQVFDKLQDAWIHFNSLNSL